MFPAASFLWRLCFYKKNFPNFICFKRRSWTLISRLPFSTPIVSPPTCKFREKEENKFLTVDSKKGCGCAKSIQPSSPTPMDVSSSIVETQVPCDPTPSAGTGVPLVPDALAQPSDSSTTPGPVAEMEQTVKTMPPPPVKRAIVLALCVPSATPAAPPKGRKRSCTTSEMTKSKEGETSLRGGTGLMSQHRAKVCSSIFLCD